MFEDALLLSLQYVAFAMVTDQFSSLMQLYLFLFP